jgi:hypothetical protein
VGRKSIYILATIMIAGMLFGHMNCTSSVDFRTRSGMSVMTNPNQPTTGAKALALAICGTITRCNSNAAPNECYNAVTGLADAAPRLGLQSTSYSTLSSIIGAEQSGVLTANEISTNACHEPLETLACADSTVQAAYDPAAANPYGGALNLISDRGVNLCNEFFAPVASGIAKLSKGYDHTCALTKQGAVYCWGGNARGQLGDGSTVSSSQPVLVTGLTSGVQDISAGNAFTCAIVNGGLFCWGQGGLVGTGSWTDVHVPTVLPGLSTGVQAVSVNTYGCALQNGSVFCWGGGAQGNLGNNTGGAYAGSAVPVQVSGLSGVQSITVGGGHACAINSAGMWCWGANNNGQLGAPSSDYCYDTNCSRVPVRVTEVSGIADSLQAASGFTCALMSGGVYCWGGGTGITPPNSTMPVVLKGPAVSLSAHGPNCVVLADRTVQCWGSGVDGETGNNLPYNPGVASSVLNISDIRQVATGGQGACALTSSGQVWCWGANGSGQCGPTSTTAMCTWQACNKYPIPLDGMPQ